MPREGSGGHLGWLRAIALMTAIPVLSPVVSPGVMVVVPLALIVLFLSPRFGVSVLVASLAAFLVFGGSPASGLWYLERGWALLLGGWFLALTLRWPGGGFISRGLGAVAGTFAAIGLLFWSRPGQWAVVDWAVTSGMEEGASLVFQALRDSMGPQAVPESIEAMFLESIVLRGFIFPALLGLASLAALGTAWWLFQRLNRSPEAGIGPLGEFRFNDQLVWILILGLVFLLGFSGFLERAGANAVVFMGALYALRGVGVWLFLSGGPSFFGVLLFLVAFTLVAPFLMAGAFVFGLGDTWLNLRARWGVDPPS